MSKSIKFKNDIYLSTTSIMHNRELLSTILGNKIMKLPNGSDKTLNANAWSGTTNTIYLINNWYATYLLITSSPYSEYNMYIISYTNRNGDQKFTSAKISGNVDSTFKIDYNTDYVDIIMSKSGYWKSYLLYLGA